jgi:hypothetical protein
MPRPSPAGRWALAPPFHPYLALRGKAGRYLFCGTFPRVAAAGRYPACPHLEFGLSSILPCVCRTGPRAPASNGALFILPLPAFGIRPPRTDTDGLLRQTVAGIGEVRHLRAKVRLMCVPARRSALCGLRFPPERRARYGLGAEVPHGSRQGAIIGRYLPPRSRARQERNNGGVGMSCIPDLDLAEPLRVVPSGRGRAVEEDDDAHALVTGQPEGRAAHAGAVTAPRQVVPIQQPRHHKIVAPLVSGGVAGARALTASSVSSGASGWRARHERLR